MIQKEHLGKSSKSPASWQEQTLPQVALTSLMMIPSRHLREQTYRLLATWVSIHGKPMVAVAVRVDQITGERDMAIVNQLRTRHGLLTLLLVSGRLTWSLAFSYPPWCSWATSPQSSPIKSLRETNEFQQGPERCPARKGATELALRQRNPNNSFMNWSYRNQKFPSIWGDSTGSKMGNFTEH